MPDEKCDRVQIQEEKCYVQYSINKCGEGRRTFNEKIKRNGTRGRRYLKKRRRLYKRGPREHQLGVPGYDQACSAWQQHCRNSNSVYLMVAMLL
jgi:hypothetical protein